MELQAKSAPKGAGSRTSPAMLVPDERVAETMSHPSRSSRAAADQEGTTPISRTMRKNGEVTGAGTKRTRKKRKETRRRKARHHRRLRNRTMSERTMSDPRPRPRHGPGHPSSHADAQAPPKLRRRRNRRTTRSMTDVGAATAAAALRIGRRGERKLTMSRSRSTPRHQPATPTGGVRWRTR